MVGRERYELLALAVVNRVLDNKNPTHPFLSGNLKGRLNVKCPAGARNIYLSFDHDCCILQFAQLEFGSWIRRIDQHINRRGSWKKLVQKLQTLSIQFRPKKAHASDVASGLIKARDKPCHNGVAGVDKNNRNLCR